MSELLCKALILNVFKYALCCDSPERRWCMTVVAVHPTWHLTFYVSPSPLDTLRTVKRQVSSACSWLIATTCHHPLTLWTSIPFFTLYSFLFFINLNYIIYNVRTRYISIMFSVWRGLRFLVCRSHLTLDAWRQEPTAKVSVVVLSRCAKLFL